MMNYAPNIRLYTELPYNYKESIRIIKQLYWYDYSRNVKI
jgi:hypothetical protein